MDSSEIEKTSRAASPAPTIPAQTQREDEDVISTRPKRKLDDMAGSHDANSQQNTLTLAVNVTKKPLAQASTPSATPTPGQKPILENPLTPVKTPSHKPARSVEQDAAEDQEPEELEDDSDQSDPGEPIERLDWADLEDRFMTEMSAQQQKEADSLREWNDLMEVTSDAYSNIVSGLTNVQFFSIWSAVPGTHELDRCKKRLRTRMSHVQNSERLLEDKRERYLTVVNAFQKALALFNE
ncbi:hypothetical protein EJ05DRAFT_541341 [Pseudovirgaria hyperparasitica]|uniref:Uncharacterized protein n=1 Tax=Pseudovirgaria hyperparasitica TaxID=470096 RepID=A0A6A6VWL9_9PEZI|nr:uncharacterized protein EJ05DRAFT_541341 [Pseudovirgaria hyperparasitica]KAF2754249.1 hypothetical protein EJ05DRAFT_541341 [Pseudovirgaria hyperparasitica]